MQPLDSSGLLPPVRPGASQVPMPRGRMAVRIGIPVGVSISLGAVILASAGEALIPARTVHVVPVVFERDSAAAPPPEGEASTAVPATGARSNRVVQAPGWLEAEPFAVACTGLADGVLEDVVVLDGERVERGQVVARLVARDAELALARAEADVAGARAEVGIAESDLGAATTDWEHPVERIRAVSATKAELEETRGEIAQLPALIGAERAALERLVEEHNRAKQALESGAANQIEEIIARKRVDEQTGVVRAAELRGAMLEAKRDRLAAEVIAAEEGAALRVEETRALSGARAALAQSRARLAQAEVALEEARLRLDRMTIRAPLSGYIQRRLKAPGDKVMLGMDDPASAQIALIYDPARLQVRVDVPLADASAVHVGQECEVVVDVLPDRVFAGEVVLMTNEADLQKNTLQVKVKVKDPDPMLRPEMLTRVKFLADASGSSAEPDAPSVLRLEESALDQGGGGQARVWVVRERRGLAGDAQPVPVEVVSVSDGWARVRGDLRAGDLVAVGAPRLRSGERVRIVADHSKGGGS